ncbi:unnamed protein product [Rotaria sp. Silwood2]|nr:unnamed protein product [Rotaria sp. Silwood2]CAF3031320.1 unnamed protein product [Rotaria sp. Silwood2]CAF3279745.1 unnamed protein product [Rotaria sp. Silwood2]CAF4134042.1 unnamed protein product [Rotaria sp. Silwood2]CAF4158293.1 unnamed protein product [Rotaria sp. Silwood2]
MRVNQTNNILSNTYFTFLVLQVHHQLDKNLNLKILFNDLRSSFNIDEHIHGPNDLVYDPNKRQFSDLAYPTTSKFTLHHDT